MREASCTSRREHNDTRLRLHMDAYGLRRSGLERQPIEDAERLFSEEFQPKLKLDRSRVRIYIQTYVIASTRHEDEGS